MINAHSLLYPLVIKDINTLGREENMSVFFIQCCECLVGLADTFSIPDGGRKGDRKTMGDAKSVL